MRRTRSRWLATALVGLVGLTTGTGVANASATVRPIMRTTNDVMTS